MAHTDAHQPFKTSSYAQATEPANPIIEDGQAYMPINSTDYTEYNQKWHESKNRFPKTKYRQDEERRTTKSNRRTNNVLLRTLSRNPDSYDDMIFEEDRTDVFAWS